LELSIIILVNKFAVLDGEVAVPYNLQSAIAGLKSCLRLVLVGPGPSKWWGWLGPAQRKFTNPVRSGRKQQ